MKTVGIKELKNNLSAYLREVRQGVRILVSDRNTIVAELHEPGALYTASGGDDLILSEWIAQKTVSQPMRAKEPLPPSPVCLPAGTAARLLDADRGAGS